MAAKHLITIAILAASTLTACAPVERSLKDYDLFFSSQEERVAYWRTECDALGTTEEQMPACIQKQQELYQDRTGAN